MPWTCPEPPPEAFAHNGVFDVHQALGAGWTLYDVEVALSTRVTTDLGRGVFAFRSALEGLTAEQRHVVALQADLLSLEPGWCAARRTAALLWQIPLIGRPPKVPQLVRDGKGTRSKGTSRHRRVSPLPPDQRTEIGGIPTATHARTVVDIARQEVFRNGVVAADAVLRSGTSREELKAVLATQRRWPGVVRARQVVEFADGRAESPGESVARVACLLEGLPIPEPQVEVWIGSEFIARLDGLIKDRLLAVEFNGALKFTDAGVLPALLERDERIKDCGIGVVQTNWGETFSHTAGFGRRMRLRLQEQRRLAPGVRLVSTAVPGLLAA